MAGSSDRARIRPVRPRVVDLRLLGPAVATWTGAFVAISVLSYSPLLRTPLWVATTMAAAVLLGARRRVSRVAGLACGGLVIGIVVASLRVVVVDGSVVSELAAEGAYVRAEIAVASDPVRHEGAVRGDRRTAASETARATLTLLVARGQTWSMSLPIGLRWSPGVIPGPVVVPTSRWEVSGFLSSAQPGSGRAAVLTVTGARQIGPPSLVSGATTSLRAGLREAVDGLPGDAPGLLPGLAVGDTSRLDLALSDDMRSAGLTHLTAVSGSNVAMVVLVVLALAGTLRVRGRWRFVIGLVTILGFVALVRPDPSVVRAATMGVIALMPMLFGGRVRATASLCAAVLVLVLLDPWLATSYGFGLSVLATAGLIAGAVRLAARLRAGLPPGLPSWLIEAVAVTTCAQIAVAPLLAAMGGSLGPAALPANVLASFAVAPATALGVASALLGSVSPPGAHGIAWLAAAPTQWIAWTAHLCAGLPSGTWAAPAGLTGAGVVIGSFAVAWGTWRIRHRLRRRVRGVGQVLGARPRTAVTAITLTTFLVYVGPAHRGVSSWPPEGWVFVACDVGQGDALVLRTADEEAVVVDAGPDPRAVDRCLSDLGVRVVSLLILTHFHADHVEGVPGVLRHRKVGAIEVSPLSEPADGVRRVADWARGSGVPTRVAVVDEVGRIGDLQWQVLWPRRLIRGQGSDPNNSSIVLLARTGGLRILLTGDIEPAAQAALRHDPRHAAELSHLDVVKVPHHGSRHQDPASAAAWRPALAVISVGEGNDYGHPAAPTIASYESVGATVVRTDQRSDIAVVPDAAGVRVVTRV